MDDSSSTTTVKAKNKCIQLMEDHYDGNFPKQDEKTFISLEPTSLMSDPTLSVALMAQTYPLLDTWNEGTYADMQDEVLRAHLMELAEKGTGVCIIFLDGSYARVFRFVEFEHKRVWRAGPSLGIDNIRNMPLTDPRRFGYKIIMNPGIGSPVAND